MEFEGKIRLARFLALCGIDSRRHCEKLIFNGRVTVNGTVVREPGIRVAPVNDVVKVDGIVAGISKKRIYIMLNKPAGFIVSMNDPEGRPTVSDFFSSMEERIFPVGRLDYDTTGLLLMTNDGFLSHRLTHPSFGIRKVYSVKVNGKVTGKTTKALIRGIMLDGKPGRMVEIELLRVSRGSSDLNITVDEGRNRFVRRIFDAVGHPVIKLHRIGLGPISLGRLKQGMWRNLRSHEIKALKNAVVLD